MWWSMFKMWKYASLKQCHDIRNFYLEYTLHHIALCSHRGLVLRGTPALPLHYIQEIKSVSLSPVQLCHPMSYVAHLAPLSWDSPGKNTGGRTIPFSRGSSQPRNWSRDSCIGGRFFAIWATRKPIGNQRLAS